MHSAVAGRDARGEESLTAEVADDLSPGRAALHGTPLAPAFLAGAGSVADIADCVTAPASAPSIQRPRSGRLQVSQISSGRFGGVLLTVIDCGNCSAGASDTGRLDACPPAPGDGRGGSCLLERFRSRDSSIRTPAMGKATIPATMTPKPISEQCHDQCCAWAGHGRRRLAARMSATIAHTPDLTAVFPAARPAPGRPRRQPGSDRPARECRR